VRPRPRSRPFALNLSLFLSLSFYLSRAYTQRREHESFNSAPGRIFDYRAWFGHYAIATESQIQFDPRSTVSLFAESCHWRIACTGQGASASSLISLAVTRGIPSTAQGASRALFLFANFHGRDATPTSLEFARRFSAWGRHMPGTQSLCDFQCDLH